MATYAAHMALIPEHEQEQNIMIEMSITSEVVVAVLASCDACSQRTSGSEPESIIVRGYGRDANVATIEALEHLDEMAKQHGWLLLGDGTMAPRVVCPTCQALTRADVAQSFASQEHEIHDRADAPIR